MTDSTTQGVVPERSFGTRQTAEFLGLKDHRSLDRLVSMGMLDPPVMVLGRKTWRASIIKRAQDRLEAQSRKAA